jgi:hypothetical protein
MENLGPAIFWHQLAPPSPVAKLDSDKLLSIVNARWIVLCGLKVYSGIC